MLICMNKPTNRLRADWIIHKKQIQKSLSWIVWIDKHSLTGRWVDMFVKTSYANVHHIFVQSQSVYTGYTKHSDIVHLKYNYQWYIFCHNSYLCQCQSAI